MRARAILVCLFLALLGVGLGAPSRTATARIGTGVAVHASTESPMAAERTPGSLVIDDLVWDDLDRDGHRDEGEPGLAGIVIALEEAAGDGHRREVDRTITDLEGRYRFENLTAAWYGVRVLAPAGWRASTPGAVPADPSNDEPALGRSAGTVLVTPARFLAEDNAAKAQHLVGIFLPDATIEVTAVGSGQPDPATGERIWTLDITNLGPEDDPGPLFVSVPVPEPFDLADAQGDGWTCAVTAAETLSCIRPEGLVDGASASITVTGRTPGSDAGSSELFDAASTTVLANVVDRVDGDQLTGVGEVAAGARPIRAAAPSALARIIIASFSASAAVLAISRAAWRPTGIGHL